MPVPTEQDLQILVIYGINHDQPRAALQTYRDYLLAGGVVTSADTFFQLALASAMAGISREETEQFRAMAWVCDDFTDEMHGDFLRDDAIWNAKRGAYHSAESQLKEADVYHRHSPDKLAANTLVRLRIQLYRDDSRCVEKLWQLVSSMMTRVVTRQEPIDLQYFEDAWFWLMVASAKYGDTHHFTRSAYALLRGVTVQLYDSGEDYTLLTSSDVSTRHRKVALWLDRSRTQLIRGPLAAWLVHKSKQ